jgi:1-deoxy-D-xylulose-5-phosphate reductoisomerase
MTSTKRNIAILGSTGSIGTQALDVIRRNPDLFQVEVLTAGTNADLLIQQAIEFKPNAVVIADEDKYIYVKQALENEYIKVFAGNEAIEQVVSFKDIDIVLTAIVGFAGLKPTIEAIKHNKVIALANKETMVVAGELITQLAKENNVPIIPVDSEHSAIFQCIQGEYQNNIKQILLTASGGAFRGKTKQELRTVTLDQALTNPNWQMGKKVTIDSASLMNKGLEVIEAKWLFDVSVDKITVVVHPQSIIHSMVEFEDGSIKAQMARADMRLPILYALSYPLRVKFDSTPLDLFDVGRLTFEKPDVDTFPCLNLAYKAIRKGGNMPCIMNAANEISVKKFLNNEISFLQIPEIISKAMDTFSFVKDCTLDTYLQTDMEVKQSLQNS